MWYDLIILGILLVAAYRGLQRGVIYQIATIASVVLCFVFAEAISAAAAPHVPLAPPLNHWVVMVGAYVVFSFVSFGFARVLQGWVEKAKMKEFNRHLGAGFGLLKGLAFSLVLTFFAITMSPKAREALKDSRSARYAAVIMDRIHPVMPEKLQAALDNYLAYFDKETLGNPSANPSSPFGTGVANDFGQDPLGGLGGIGIDPPSEPRPSGSPSGGSGGFLDGIFGPNGDPFANNNVPATNASTGRPEIAPPSTNNPFSTSMPNTQQLPPDDGFSVEDIIDRFPWTLSGEVGQLVREGLQSATPEQRRYMEQQLNDVAARNDASMLGDLARGWLNGNLPGRTQNPGTTSQPGGGFVDDLAGSIYDRATGTQTQPGQSNPTRDMVRGIAGDFLNRQFGNTRPTNNGGTAPAGSAPVNPFPPSNGGSNTQPSGSGLGDAIGGFANQFLNRSQPAAPPVPDTNAMIREVASAYARTAAEQTNYEQSIARQLSALPPQAVTTLLQDWRHDLSGRGADPDPNTTRTSSLEERIRNVSQRLGLNVGGSAF